MSPNESSISPPEIQKSAVVFNEFIKIERDDLLFSGKTKHPYYTLTTKPKAVVVLAFNLDGLLILNEEYRHPTRQTLLCCPGGFLDKNESPEEAGKRELLEESGYLANSLQLIGKAYPYPGITGQKIFFLRALKAIKYSKPNREPTELIRTVLKSPASVHKEISSGREADSQLCSALYFNSIA